MITAQVLDLLAVVAFVVFGRRTHQESNAVLDVLETLAPFLIGLVAGWLVARVRVSPMALRTGTVVWAVTIAVGMFMRRVAFGEGIAPVFILVTSLFLAACFLGWRLLAARLSAPTSS